MFDASTELSTYYEKHVRLGQDLRNNLAGYRQLNLDRLSEGLKALGEKRKVQYKDYAENKNQGSYAMHTLNQCEHTDYDIDVAVVWNKADLPSDAKEARELVRDALLEKCQNFSREPTARGNAVTVWYADGYHIDFAVYRRTTDAAGNVTSVEHAGADGWATREPLAYSDWFDAQVTTRSPPTQFDQIVSAKVTVPTAQLRRIVRFVKAFARSRSGWALPGGIVISTLVCETYVRDGVRDDVALAKTLRALLARLRTNLDVQSPVQPGTSLVQSEKRKKEMERLRDKLAEKLPALDVLEQYGCTRKQAMSAWFDVFNHSFWSEEAKVVAERASAAGGPGLELDCWLAKSEGGAVYRQYRSGGPALPKHVSLRFTANVVGVVGPYQLRWSALNEGDEAADAGPGQLSWDKLQSAGVPMWTSTAYKGRHRMVCEVVQNGSVMRRGEYVVRIGPGR